MKAILQYTDCMRDDKNVFGVLALNNVEVIKTKQGMSIYPLVTIRVKDTDTLNKILKQLNEKSRRLHRLELAVQHGVGPVQLHPLQARHRTPDVRQLVLAGRSVAGTDRRVALRQPDRDFPGGPAECAPRVP